MWLAGAKVSVMPKGVEHTPEIVLTLAEVPEAKVSVMPKGVEH